MRRKDREITDRHEIEQIIEKSDSCRLALSDNNVPYLVALNYGYHDGTFYFHCAHEGKKLEIIRKNNRACIQIDTDHELVRGNSACEWGMKFRSVIGMGTIEIIQDQNEKINALHVLMRHYSDQTSFEYQENLLEKTTLLKMKVSELSGKKKGY